MLSLQKRRVKRLIGCLQTNDISICQCWCSQSHLRMRVAPGFSPSSFSLVQEEGSQQKGDNALINCAVVSKANAVHLLSLWDTDAVVQRCSLLCPAQLQVLFRHNSATAATLPCAVHVCSTAWCGSTSSFCCL